MQCSPSSGDLLANAIRHNVMLNVEKLKSAAPILKLSVDDKKIRVVGGVYKLKTGQGRACWLSGH